MDNTKGRRKLLLIISGFVLLSIILILCTLAAIITDTSPGSNPKTASIGAFVAIVLRGLALLGFYFLLRSDKRRGKIDRGLCAILGILMFIFGIAVIDGAFEFQDQLSGVSVLYFITALSDLVAATLSIIVVVKYRNLRKKPA